MRMDFLFFQLFNLALLASWVILSFVTFLEIRKRQFTSDTARALWVFIVLVFPILGAGAFWLVNPGVRSK